MPVRFKILILKILILLHKRIFDRCQEVTVENKIIFFPKCKDIYQLKSAFTGNDAKWTGSKFKVNPNTIQAHMYTYIYFFHRNEKKAIQRCYLDFPL